MTVQEFKEKYSQNISFMKEQYRRKNSDYGNSFSKNFIEYGFVSSLIRLDDKINRYYQLKKSSVQNVKDESIKDTLIDCASYSLMSIGEVWAEDIDLIDRDMPELFDQVIEHIEFNDSYEDSAIENFMKFDDDDIAILFRHLKYYFKNSGEIDVGDLAAIAFACVSIASKM